MQGLNLYSSAALCAGGSSAFLCGKTIAHSPITYLNNLRTTPLPAFDAAGSRESRKAVVY